MCKEYKPGQFVSIGGKRYRVSTNRNFPCTCCTLDHGESPCGRGKAKTLYMDILEKCYEKLPRGCYPKPIEK